MGFGSLWHWVLVLLIVVLIFGTKKLRNIGEDLGGAVKGFKDGMKGGSEPPAQAPSEPPVVQQQAPKQVTGEVIDVEVKK